MPLDSTSAEIVEEICGAYEASSMPPWREAYMAAVHAAFDVCRPSTQFKFGPHLGDWFAVTRNVPASALPPALKIGIGRKYTADFKRSTSKRYFGMIRVPLGRFWHPAWRPIITRAIIESGGP